MESQSETDPGVTMFGWIAVRAFYRLGESARSLTGALVSGWRSAVSEQGLTDLSFRRMITRTTVATRAVGEPRTRGTTSGNRSAALVNTRLSSFRRKRSGRWERSFLNLGIFK